MRKQLLNFIKVKLQQVYCLLTTENEQLYFRKTKLQSRKMQLQKENNIITKGNSILQIKQTVHLKPTPLHSHLRLPPHTGKRSKSKRECKQPHGDSAFIPDKTQPTPLRTDRRAADNSTFAIGGVPFSADSLVVAESFVLRIKFSGKNPAHRKSAKRYVPYSDTKNLTE